MPGLFDPLTIRGVTLRNRVGVSPMCQYSCGDDGRATDWHLVHLGSRAVGGAGLILMEDTAVSRQGRISPADHGLWEDGQIEPLRRITAFLDAQGAVPGVQLGHAGRKASSRVPWDGDGHAGAEGVALLPEEGGWETVAPSAITYGGHRFGRVTPREIAVAEIHAVQGDFREAARRALAAGFRWLEIHADNGYLLSTFHSPLANTRTDAYGGSLDNRLRCTLETVAAVREAWPESLPLSVRFAVTDWAEGGFTVEEGVELARRLSAAGVDLMNCVSGGTVREQRVPWAVGVNVPLSQAVKEGAGCLVSANGLITEPTHAEEIVRHGRADLVLLAREFLRSPYWPRHAARVLGASESLPWPSPYGHWLG